MKEFGVDYSNIPYAAISEGRVNHNKSLSGYELDTHAFRQEIGRTFKLTDADNHLENSFLCWQSGRPVTAIIRQMSMVLPEILHDYDRRDNSKVEAYDHLNQMVVEQLVIARSLATDKLDSLNIPEDEILLPKNVKQYDSETQTAISNVQEYAWYLTLAHQRWIMSVVRKSPEWNESDSEDKANLLQASFIDAWKLALKYDPEKGNFTTYLGASLPTRIQHSYSEIKGLTRNIKSNYIDSFSEAQSLLDSTPFESDYWINIAASMIYDRKVGRLAYDQENFIDALIEYENLHLNPYGRKPLAKSSFIKWKRRHITGQTVRARIKKTALAVGIYNPASSDEIRYTDFRNPKTGEIETIDYSLDEFLTSGENVEEQVFANLRKEAVSKALEKLTDDERELIEKKYGFNGQLEMSNSELAIEYKVTSQTIRNRLEKIRNKIDTPYNYLKLRDFAD